MSDHVRAHPLAFPQAALDDLRERLARTRWPDKETVDDAGQGAPLARMRRLINHWQGGYDWRAAEARLNALGPSMTTVDGQDIHFLHVRSPEPNAVPLVITHGWPGSLFEIAKSIPLLVDPRAHDGDPKDAFHVVVPSMPGFGLSGKPTRPGWNADRIARAWIELMRRLGYERFVAQGGDWGYAITNALGGIGLPAVQAVHLNMFPVFETLEARDGREKQGLARLRDFQQNKSGYQAMQIQSPQTIGYGLTDSPVGIAAWLYELYDRWTDHAGDPEQALSRDDMLDNITFYWLTESATSSARIYWENMRTFQEAPIAVPVGFTQFPADLHLASERWVRERYPTLVHYAEASRGGHFPAWEQPAIFADEVRAAFRSLRR